MTLVVDASLAVGAVIQQDADGEWARRVLASDNIVASHQMPAEVAAVLRRRTLARDISEETAFAAYSEFLSMNIDFQPFHPFAGRIWQLRHTVIINDAWYVALAEYLDVPLATLDLRLTRAPGSRCRFLTPNT